MSASSSWNSKPETFGMFGVGALGREAEDACSSVRVVERVAVGDVELGAEVRVEAVAGDVPLAGRPR